MLLNIIYNSPSKLLPITVATQSKVSLAQMLELWVRIPFEAWMSVFILCLCQVAALQQANQLSKKSYWMSKNKKLKWNENISQLPYAPSGGNRDKSIQPTKASYCGAFPPTILPQTYSIQFELLSKYEAPDEGPSLQWYSGCSSGFEDCITGHIKKSRHPCYRPLKTLELWEVETPTLLRQTANRRRQGCQPYTPPFNPRFFLFFFLRFLVLVSVRGWVPQPLRYCVPQSHTVTSINVPNKCRNTGKSL
jgi:hypothetical protein